MNNIESYYAEPQLKSRVANADQLYRLVVAFGLFDELERGRFVCPCSGEIISRDNLARIKIDGKTITLYSVNATIPLDNRAYSDIN
jgi:hypothetical protein